MSRRNVHAIIENNIESFLCVVYAYYYENILPVGIALDGFYQPQLGVDEYHVITDIVKAQTVYDAVEKKISYASALFVVHAFMAANDDRLMNMFQYIVLGFKKGPDVDAYLQLDYVLATHKNARAVGGEAHLLTGFCRFSETTSGVYYCAISPVNDVLSILADHFSERMNYQNWIIHDTKRNKAAIYNGKEYQITMTPKDAAVEYTDEELLVQDLWKTFFKTVAITERINKKLQRNNLPLHHRKHMTEFE